jgi:cytochrome c oxidase subunit 4
MSDSHSHDVAKHVKVYVMVFVALLIGTAVTVWLNLVHFDSKVLTIFIALFVAVVKAALVAGFFMHLISERKAIYAIMLATVFFFGGMMYLTLWSRAQIPVGTIFYGSGHGPPASAAGAAN